MSSTNKYDGQKRPSYSYKNLQNELFSRCPGQCTCDYGTRSNYDQLQYQLYINGGIRPELKTVKNFPDWNRKM